MKTTLAIVSLLSVLLQPLVPAAAEIVNVTSARSAHHFMVEYDLESSAPVMVNVDITVEGVTYGKELLSLEGDVGRYVAPGTKKKFVWNAKRDFPKWPDLEVTVQSKAHHLR